MSSENAHMKLLVSNDDGILSEGLVELAAEFAGDFEVYVCAPERERSAASHSITLHKPLRLTDFSSDYPDGVEAALACSGSPTDSVALGVKEVIGGEGPDLILSGINSGPNLAEDVTYSGTVAAAMEGAVLGFPSLAVSHGDSGFLHLPTSVRVARTVVEWMRELVKSGDSKGSLTSRSAQLRAPLLNGDIFLNLNVPAVPWDELGELSVSRLGTREYQDVVHENADPRGRPYYWIAGEQLPDIEQQGTDVWAFSQDIPVLTPLLHDLTAKSYLDGLTGEMERWRKDPEPGNSG